MTCISVSQGVLSGTLVAQAGGWTPVALRWTLHVSTHEHVLDMACYAVPKPEAPWLAS